MNLERGQSYTTDWDLRKARLTCKTHCWSACECKLSNPRTFRRYGATPSSRSRAHADPPSRRDPAAAARTGCRWSASRHLAESREIPESARTARTQSEGAATMTPTSVRLLPDRIRPHLDSTMEGGCGRDWWRTANVHENIKGTSWPWTCVTTHHLNCFRVDRLGDDAVVVVYVLYHLLQGTSFHLLPFQIVQRLGEIEENAALPKLLDEKLLALGGVGF